MAEAQEVKHAESTDEQPPRRRRAANRSHDLRRVAVEPIPTFRNYGGCENRRMTPFNQL